jgi:hypothetical protein
MDLIINIDSSQYDTLRKTLGVSDTPRLFPDADIKAVANSIMESPTHGNALANAIVDQYEARIASEVAGQIDAQVIADCINMDDLANCIDLSQMDHGDIAGNIDLSDLAREIDGSDIAEHFAASDIAEMIDLHEVARHVDTNEIADLVAEKVIEDQAVKVAENVSVADIVANINHKQIALHLVQSVVHNEEFRNCLINALIERLVLTVPMSDEFLKSVDMARNIPVSSSRI